MLHRPLGRSGLACAPTRSTSTSHPGSPHEETLGAYADLIKAGKVRAIGCSNFEPATLRAKTYMTDRGFRIVAALESVAERLQATPGQVAVAWVMALPAIAAPIASGRTVEQVRDLIAAAKLVLDAESLHTLETASA